jgi:proteasome assembly chaperone 4
MISVETKYFPSPDSSLPALALQVTQLVDSYLLWIGVFEGLPDEVHKAPLHGRLTRDWACAMPTGTIDVRILNCGSADTN